MIDSREERLGKFRRNRAKFPRVWFYRRSRDKVGANVEKARNTGIASNLFPSSLFSSGRGTDRSPFRGLKYFLRRVGDIFIYGQDGVCPGRNNFDSRLCPVSREHTLTLNKFLLARNSIVYFLLSKHSSRSRRFVEGIALGRRIRSKRFKMIDRFEDYYFIGKEIYRNYYARLVYNLIGCYWTIILEYSQRHDPHPYITRFIPLPCIFTLPQSKSFQFCSLVLKFQFPSPNPFVEARDYECHRFFIVSKRRPLKFSLLESFP